MGVIAGEGSRLSYAKYTNNVLGSYTEVGQVVSISGPQRKLNKVEYTHLTSPKRLYRPSNLADMGELKLKVYFTGADDTHVEMNGFIDDPETVNWKIEYTDGSIGKADGFVTGLDFSGIEIDQNVQADVTVAITGDYVITPAP